MDLSISELPWQAEDHCSAKSSVLHILMMSIDESLPCNLATFIVLFVDNTKCIFVLSQSIFQLGHFVLLGKSQS